MNNMKFLEKIKSKVDSTIKYIFLTHDNLVVEFSYINKNDGKDIICVPTQTSCRMKCKFCHISDISHKLIHRNLVSYEITEAVNYIHYDLKLIKQKMLLVSFMGCGEPLENYNEVIYAMEDISVNYAPARFAIATSLPASCHVNFFKFTDAVAQTKLNVKVHLSLHYTMNSIRKEWMPLSLPIKPSITALQYYKQLTNNNVEIHYALIEGVNDSEQDAFSLSYLLTRKNIPVKFLLYNEKESLDCHASGESTRELFSTYCKHYQIPHEFYTPPGIDVGASCGQFLLDYYLKYNLRKEL